MEGFVSALVVSSPEVAAAGAFGFAFGLAAGALVGKRHAPKKNIFDHRPPYKPGQTPSLPGATFGTKKQIFNPTELASAYNLMISTVTPRPIALVSSTSQQGVDNVAPFSYFGCVGHDPPMVSIGFCRKGRDFQRKDSLVNILEQKEFCVNIMSEWYIDAANHACGMFPPEVDEFQVSGLTKVHDCQVVKAPRVGQAAVTYECLLEYVHPVVNDKGQPTTEIILAKVVRVHVDEDVLKENYDKTKPEVDTVKLRPLGRLGGNVYTSLGDTVDIPRPNV
jgi:flavin reductase (DIM6/NTAB) family NADH-FMN oxidoreductase RutF